MPISGLLSLVSNGILLGSKQLSRKGLYPFLKAQFEGIPRGARVLSVGSGGAVQEKLDAARAMHGFSVVTLDIDPNRQPDIVGDLCTHDLGARVYDVVVLAEVLEHLHAPHLAIVNVLRALRPGGLLILTVPFLFPIHERPVDYFRYTRYGLAHLLRDFHEVTITERNTWPEALGVVAARLALEPGTGARLAAPIAVLGALAAAPLASIVGRLISTDFVTTGYVVTARAPTGLPTDAS